MQENERKLFPCSRGAETNNPVRQKFNFSQLSQKSAQNYETRWTKGVRAKKAQVFDPSLINELTKGREGIQEEYIQIQ